MGINTSAGTVVSRPRLYQTVPVSTLSQAEQQDRFPTPTELDRLADFYRLGQLRLQVAGTISQNYEGIVSQAAGRIFTGGAAMTYLEKPLEDTDGTMEQSSSSALGTEFVVEASQGFGAALRNLFSTTSVAIPPGFRTIDVGRYGTANMTKSLRDMAWFLRYITYAIVAGDPSILAVNTRSLREIIEAACSSESTLVALRVMKQAAGELFANAAEAKAISDQYFDVALTEFVGSAPSNQVRQRKASTGVKLQGLQLPQIYNAAAEQVPVFKMKPGLSEGEKQGILKAAYRQVFERDIRRAYGQSISDLESKVKNGEISMKEFIRRLGKTEFYRKQFYEPFVNSRVVELAFRHFLGRGPETTEEFSAYFAIVTQKGLNALVDALVDSAEYGDYFGDEIVPYLRKLGVEAQTSANWGAKFDLFNYAAPRRKVPQFITLFSDYKAPLPDQHAYGKSNDSLEIQFGAIFPKDTVSPSARPALVNKDVKRILIASGITPGNGKATTTPTYRTTSLAPTVVRLGETSVQRVICTCYVRVYGFEPYSGQRLSLLETRLSNGDITVREFVRQLAKSKLFRDKYWSTMYVVKAIEFLHRRLLGRPTFGRQEINALFDIASKDGYYAVVDALVDSKEYVDSFGEDAVPYERYVTPGGLMLRNMRLGATAQSTTIMAPMCSPLVSNGPKIMKTAMR
ncbi:phycobilisome rod-core linker polypeptide [Synechococcus sp. PCC 7336]|uniref:phycobilisome rod-core linker polypeptide n=1 Tax=Synechococcus sp. PCC 7336 TaxID=195250 RepID=UPI000347D626|nr:phycobilisome rod-core linker polypeptide [Synechococcus sp. PCC 7336]